MVYLKYDVRFGSTSVGRHTVTFPAEHPAASNGEIVRERTFRSCDHEQLGKAGILFDLQRLLDSPADPLSGNCGGDCWGCVGAIEA